MKTYRINLTTGGGREIATATLHMEPGDEDPLVKLPSNEHRLWRQLEDALMALGLCSCDECDELWPLADLAESEAAEIPLALCPACRKEVGAVRTDQDWGIWCTRTAGSVAGEAYGWLKSINDSEWKGTETEARNHAVNLNRQCSSPNVSYAVRRRA